MDLFVFIGFAQSYDQFNDFTKQIKRKFSDALRLAKSAKNNLIASYLSVLKMHVRTDRMFSKLSKILLL